ncbi:subtilisin-like protein [Gloeophyllum trabeum ATCC 11539]|uniref:tripeptidyl-peptidase II n=1 Tax=Gloeophyllum trabeum (strain ATCC 11539 / FP-39264 / Madison 617) TaxID=670483 RepID=S7PVU9_GLOTA|nr:subtilisin-like protein [Gloeophyllum trabeum ATCC 11539]EPQ51643.1 subtilisin-like protein [Gloeophyllum trabeum ATCC 11539]
MLFLPLVSLALLSLASAEPRISPLITHEKRSHIPAGWSHTHRHDPVAVLPLRIGLVQSNMDKLEKLLLDVSGPESANYGKHWSAGKVSQTFAPSRETVDTVRDWLTGSGIEASRVKLSGARTWIELNATVEEAERLLNTEYHVYSHTTGKEHVACDSYKLPEHVSKHVDFILPSIHFDAVIKRDNNSSGSGGTLSNIGQPGVGLKPKTTGTIGSIINELEACDQQITLICLRALYGIVYVPVATDRNSYGIVEYTPQAYLQTDLNMFFGNFSPNLVGKSPAMVSVDGGYAQTEYTGFGYNGESDLDLQYGMSLVDPLPVTLYQTGDMVEGASFNNFLDAIDGSYCTFEGGDDPYYDSTYPDPYGGGYEGPEDCGTAAPAHVISTSYGYNEAELSPAYAARQCAEYAKLGLMGTTVLYSSGDDGVAGNGNVCLDANGNEVYGGTRFNPTFPGVCPYVTSVGATQVNPGASVTEPESACMQVIYSGGGFSNYFALPSYQAAAVEHYLTAYPPAYSASQYNATGKARGFPDVAANGANYVVAVDGEFELVYGTSASSPVTGSILTLVNDARLAIGKSPIGFINPTIYSPAFAGAFHDITTGSNPGCGTNGFNATPGWDPVTGLGTPNFPQLLARWLALP